MAVPYRTGIGTIQKLLRKICKIILLFRPAMEEVLTTEQMVYVDALNAACENFLGNVPNPRP